MPRVLIADKLSPSAVRVFEKHSIEADTQTGLREAELKACIGQYDGLAVRSATKVTAGVLGAGENLKVIGRAGLGVDNIDVAEATSRGIVVMNTPGGNAVTTAEHTVALMFALARHIPAADRSTQAGKWEKAKFLGVELAGKTLGVIGCGNVGAIVAERAIGLKMHVVAHDPYLSPERAKALGVEQVKLDELFARADFLSLHVPLSEATRDMIDAKAIGRMKKGVRIINCARGGIIVDEDLRAGLEDGHVAGAAVDVFLEEPAVVSPLFGLDNVIATPHLGAATAEAQENVAVQVAVQMSDYLISGAVVNAVNVPSLTAEEASTLRPYLKLAELLGSFAGQLTETGLKAATIEYAGEVAKLNTRILSATMLQGLLAPLLESVNVVSAPVIAGERGIAVKEVSYDRDVDYQTLINLVVTTERGDRGVAGTLFGGDKPHIVRIAGIPIEAVLGPHMLFIRNRDTPGIVGNLGRTLGDAGVNIATFNLGRTGPGGDALALIEVDESLTVEVIRKIQALPHIIQVKALDF